MITIIFIVIINLKIKFQNLNTTNVCILFYVGPHTFFSIHKALNQGRITWCLIFQPFNFIPTSHQCTNNHPLEFKKWFQLTRVAFSIELNLWHRTRTQSFSEVYSKSLCFYAPAHLSQFDERSRYFASKFHRNRP
jgi:hypothetical protein